MIEGVWSKHLIELRVLKHFLRNSPLREIENFLQKGENSLDSHVLILTCEVEISGEDSLIKSSSQDTKQKMNMSTLVILTMSKPMYHINPTSKALSNMYNKYLTSNKFSEYFRVNRVYFISRLTESSKKDFDFWILPFSLLKK